MPYKKCPIQAKGVFINTLVGGAGQEFFSAAKLFRPPLTRWKTFSTPPSQKEKLFWPPPPHHRKLIGIYHSNQTNSIISINQGINWKF